MRLPRPTLLLVVLATLVPAAAAHAAAPANDDIASAQSLDPLPAAVSGTTVDATVVASDPAGECGGIGGGVWYTTTPTSSGRVVVAAAANGKLDLIVEAYKLVRSETSFLSCDASDDNGNAATAFQATKGATYVVRVSQRFTSVSGTFSLQVSAPIPPAQPPGKQLPAAGVTRTLDRITNPDDAWSYRFGIGISYRIHLTGRGGHCTTTATLFTPRAKSFSDGSGATVKLDCGQYRLFTPRPGEEGRYSLHVVANSSFRGPQRYHLQVAPAGPDDTAPGIPLHSHGRVHGSLSGAHIDLVDLYRFTVVKRSVTYLRLSAADGLFMQLINQRGRHISSGSSIRVTIPPGHYFVAVRADGNASGSYTLGRTERLITGTRTTLSGGLGGLTATVKTTPSAAGRFVITFERFDPLAGWLFAREVHLNGHGTVRATYDPPGPGRYRAKAVYLGSRAASGSRSGFAGFVIADSGDQ